MQARWTADAQGRRRFTDARAAMADLKLQQPRGELLPTAQALAAFGTLVLRCRSRLLAVPRKVAPRLAAVRSAVEAEAIVRREIESALTELSRPSAFDEPDDSSNIRAHEHRD